jgi:hypothetical protein
VHPAASEQLVVEPLAPSWYSDPLCVHPGVVWIAIWLLDIVLMASMISISPSSGQLGPTKWRQQVKLKDQQHYAHQNSRTPARSSVSRSAANNKSIKRFITYRASIWYVIKVNYPQASEVISILSSYANLLNGNKCRTFI